MDKPKLLFLDDRSNRIHAALERFSDEFDVTIVPNVKQCLRELSRQDFKEVWLDHDLLGDDFQDPNSPESGMEVIRYIAKTGWPEHKNRPFFYIHSRNVFAATLMKDWLEKMSFRVQCAPFEFEHG